MRYLIFTTILILTKISCAGNFYGMTAYGGTHDKGTIFKWENTTNVYTKVFDFDSINGALPYGGLMQFNDKLYGMTINGGTSDGGVIFEYDPQTNIFIKKMDLKDSTGKWPWGEMSIYNNKLCGIMQWGGSNGGGVIFEWDPLTNIYTRKINLIDSSGSGSTGTLKFYNNKFYGMSTFGGAGTNRGVIFEWDPVSNIYTRKLNLTNINGFAPDGSIVLYNDKFYGLTLRGGMYSRGVIFEWDPALNILSKKIDLSDSLGANPHGDLTIFNNKLYGMAETGGSAGVSGLGVLFEWDPQSNIYTKKMDFIGANGSRPNGNLNLIDSLLIGMATNGGAAGYGNLFEWNPVTNNFSTKIDLGGINGARPFSGKLMRYQCPHVTITPDSLPNGLVGGIYHVTLSQTGLTDSIKWHITPNLPGSLLLDSLTGEITGTPSSTNSQNYTITVTNRVCVASKTSNLSIYLSTRIKNDLSKQLYIYPNPGIDNVKVTVPAEFLGKEFSIKIYNVSGSVVYSSKSEKEVLDVNISHFPKGNYILELSNEKGAATAKLEKISD